MIIDIHVHLVGMNRANGCFISPRLSSGLMYHLLSWELGMTGVGQEDWDLAYRDQVVTWADESELDGVGLLAFDALYDELGQFDHDRTQFYVSNDYCFGVCEYSEKLLPIASVNPWRRDAMDELARVYEKGAVALKLLPNSHGVDPSDERFRRFWTRVADLGLPLISHTSFEHTIPAVEQSYGKPERLRLPLECGVQVIAAHCAGSGVAHPFQEDYGTWREMLDEHENLWGDISAMASVSRFPYIHRVLADEKAQERVCLGSDFPIPVSPMVFSPQIGWQKARELGQLTNPFQQNLEVFRALGVKEEIFRRGAQLLRLPESFVERHSR